MRIDGRLRYAILLTLLYLLISTVGCTLASDRLGGMIGSEPDGPTASGTRVITLPTLAPTPVTPEPTAAVAAVQPTPWPTSTTAPSPIGVAAAIPTALPSAAPAPCQDLLFLSGGSLLRGGELGESPREVAQGVAMPSTAR